MSTEREPMLSGEQMLDMAKKSHFEPRYYEVGELPFAISIRDHYEDLITTGKLRVVEWVEAVCGEHMGLYACLCSKCEARLAPECWDYCPGCGNKIKR